MAKRHDARPRVRSRRYRAGGLLLAVLALGPIGFFAGSRAAEAAAGTPLPGTPATPDEALAALRAGNQRFTTHKATVRSKHALDQIWAHNAKTQTPFASILGCADSRVPPEIVFDQYLGDLFVVREAGNSASAPPILGSLEYGQAVLGSKLLIVLGHTSCGAVKAAFDHDKPGHNIQSVVDAIAPGIQGAKTVDDAVVANVRASIERVRAQSDVLRDAEKDGKIKIVGAVYDIQTGAVRFLEP